MRATGLVAALALLWGSGFFWIKLALGGFTPLQLTFSRLALGALVLLPIIVARRLTIPRNRAIWGHLSISAAFACALPYTLFALAEQTVSSSLAGALNSTTPLWTVLLATSLRTEGQRVSTTQVVGVVVGFAGAIVILEPWSEGPTGSATGVLICLLAALSYAIAYTYQGRFLTNRGIPPITLTAIQLTIATVFMAIALPFSGSAPPTTSPAPWFAVAILGVAGTGIALIINFTLISTEGVTTASVVTYLVPIASTALGVLFLKEEIQNTFAIGAAGILVGVALARYNRGASTRHPARR